MVKIKFTPLVLFLLLLVVLVISVLFGYKNKMFEGLTNYKSADYKHVIDVNGKSVSVDKSDGSMLIKEGVKSTVVKSNGSEDEGKEGANTMSDGSHDDASAFVYDDSKLIIPYINYGDDIYALIIDPVGKKAVASYTYVDGTETVKELSETIDLQNIDKASAGKSSGNIVQISSDIEIDTSKNKYKQGNGKWTDIRTKNVSAQIIDSDDGSYVVSMEGNSSTSNYVLFALYKTGDVITMDPVIIKYKHSSTGKSNGKGKHKSSGKHSHTDMSKYVPKTWLNPDGCPKCTNSGNCPSCSPSPTSTSSGGSGSNTPGNAPGFGGFGNNLVNQSAGIANNAIGGATALGLGTALGATVLGASAVGGATSIGNNAIGGATGLGNNAIGGATKLGQGVTNAAGNAVGTAGNVLNSTVGTAGGVVNNAVNKLTGLASGLGNNAASILTQGQKGQIAPGPGGQLMQGGQQGQGVPGQLTPYGQMISYQPTGQQYSAYQFANPMFLPYSNASVQTSDFSPIADQTGAAGISKGGNYF
jgi:hypothetical protein